MLRFLYISVVLSQLIMLLISLNGVLARESLPSGEIKKDITSEQGKPDERSPVLAVSPKEINLGVIAPVKVSEAISFSKMQVREH
jgi:hypothetical protein